MKKMSVHQALAELKTLNARITKASKEVFINYAVNNNPKVGGIDREDAETTMKSNLQSVKQLIENRKRLKEAIVASNAAVKVTIGGVEYTVASAIERKALINHEQDLLRMLEVQYNNALAYVNKINEDLPAKAEKYIATLTASDKTNRTADEIKDLANDYIKRNTVELVDPNNLKVEIETLRKSIEDFLTEVDFKLSELNATTLIDVNID